MIRSAGRFGRPRRHRPAVGSGGGRLPARAIPRPAEAKGEMAIRTPPFALPAFLASILLALPVSTAPCFGGEFAAAADGPPSLSPRAVSSPTGSFLVVAADPKEALLLLRWLEDSADYVEDVVGQPIPFGERGNLTFVLHRLGNVERPRAGTSREAAGARLAQRLVVFTRTAAVSDDVSCVLARLLLERYVWALAATNAPRKEPQPVPYWLAEGVSQSADSGLRARNCERAIAEWKQGRIPSIGRFLEGATQAPEPDPGPEAAGTAASDDPAGREATRAICSVLVSWLQSLPGGPARFQAILGRLAAGEPVTPEWLAGVVPGAKSAADLDRQWDGWMLRQKSVIRLPGVLTASGVDELGEGLLLYPGQCGMPLSDAPREPVPWRELIRRRDEPWIREFVQSKTVGLRVQSAGRGPEIAAVVERYAEFLDALGRGKSESRLTRLLETAEQALKALREKVQPALSAPEPPDRREAADGPEPVTSDP